MAVQLFFYIIFFYINRFLPTFYKFVKKPGSSSRNHSRTPSFTFSFEVTS